MRYGFTTGSCAAAAAKAAAYMLISGKLKNEIEIMTPKEIPFRTPVLEIERTENAVRCAVQKDAGDDPDVTNGAYVFAKVTADIPAAYLSQETSGGNSGAAVSCTDLKQMGVQQIIIDGGPGVGRVTKPGLDQPVGAAAINHVPREMIEKEIKEVCDVLDFKEQLYVEISIPDGVKLAEQTFNPRLGIVGGISVLGTSGIVEPMSEQALLDTIKTELNVKRAEGNTLVSVSPGNYGLDFMKRAYGFDLDTSVKCSNFIGDTIDMAIAAGFKEMLLLGHLGKLVKVSGGIFNTHSKMGDCRMELLAAAGISAGLAQEVLAQVLNCVTTEEAVNVIQSAGKLTEVMELVLERILFYVNRRAKGNLTIEVILYTNEHGELIKSAGAEGFLRRLK